MDIRERYQKFVQAEIRENANPYPTGIQGFAAGVESEFQRVLDVLQAHVCSSCERGEKLHASCDALLENISLLKDHK